MDKFTVHTGTAVPLRRSNVDTDQIIPAVYLKRITRTGFEDGLFNAWRTNEPDFVLNRPAYTGATILVAGPDFGTGSSREHAVWALHDYGFKAVISPRFADIFRGNSLKAGLLTVELAEKVVQRLWDDIEQEPDDRGHGRPRGAAGAVERRGTRFRARRLQPLAAARRARRHRSDVAAHRRDRSVRADPQALVATRRELGTSAAAARGAEKSCDTGRLRCCRGAKVVACGHDHQPVDS